MTDPNPAGHSGVADVARTPKATLMPGRRVRWVDRPLRAKGILVMVLPLLMLLVAAFTFYLTAGLETSAQALVTHTRVVEAQIEQIQVLVIDGETGIRGYLLTGDPSFLQPTDQARKELPTALNQLASLVAINPVPVEVARVQHLRQLLAPGYQLSTAGVPPASDISGRFQWLHQQKSSTDAIRAVLSSMTKTENGLLSARETHNQHLRLLAEISVGLALAIGVLGGLFGIVAFTRGVVRRLERLRSEADRLSDGEDPGLIDTADDEIGILSQRLHEAMQRQRASESNAVQARKVAETANQEKSRFLSRMSHELRTPLNAVLGFAQLLEMDADASQMDSLRQIRRAGRHLLDLINEVLDISRIESGQMALSQEPVLVADLILEVVELMNPMAAERSVTLSAITTGCDCHVQADRQRSKQVVLNLVSNAIKYNRQGGTVVVGCGEIQNGMLGIEVRDSGIGMSSADMSRLFTPFERLSAANSEIEGTGIGLALSRRLAEAMGGQLEATSTLGEGSTFILLLPLAEISGDETDSEADISSEAIEGDLSKTHRLSLLYIEDNESNVALLDKILRRRPDWRLIHAGHGQLGLELASSNPPDLILLDQQMPDMPGIEVLRRLKSASATSHIPVVAVSADATPGQIDRLEAAGAYKYLPKPIDVEELLVLLDEMSPNQISPREE